MYLCIILLLNLLFTAADQDADTGYCDADSKTCDTSQNIHDQKFLFYDVNPPEGFNLRRDVYMRFAIMLAEAQKGGKKLNWRLVLPPWYQLYHWRSQASRSKPNHWSAFFDINSLKTYAQVIELHEVFSQVPSKTLQIDILYVLQNFDDAFEGGEFKEKWEESAEDCEYDGQFWGYNNITAGEVICVRFQGKVSKLWEIISLHPEATTIMFAHGEIPLHDNYGTKPYWDCRKSMRFNKELIRTAKNFIRKHFDCNTEKCDSYLSVHWRRQDFSRSRPKDVPTITGTITQIDVFIKKNLPAINKIFIATDASQTELQQLGNGLKQLGYKVYSYVPTKPDLDRHKDGGIAIIDQIICSQAAYFVGTHESTFTFRIQEEREVLGFDSKTTFNRLCPDTGFCEKPSEWKLVN